MKKLKVIRTNAYNIEIPIEINEEKDSNWILYKFAPVDFINNNLVKFREFFALKGITEDNCIFKSFEIFSTIYIRGIFISNKDFELDKLPKELSISSTGKKNQLNMYYIDLVENKEVKSNANSIKDSENISQRGDNNNNINNNISKNKEDQINANDNNTNIFNNNKKYNLYNSLNEEISKNDNNNTSISNSTYLSKTRRNSAMKSSFYKNENKNKDTCPRLPLYPDPILSLNYIIGYSSKNCPIIKYNSFGDYDSNPDINQQKIINQSKKYIYYCSGSNIIKYDPYNRTQKIFVGHSKAIAFFTLGCKGEIIYSGEEGVNSIIRIWKVENTSCIKMLTTPLDKLKSLSESISSKYLCAAGTEQLKELIIIFEKKDLKNINIYVKKNVLFKINSIKFVPHNDEVLISCGNENIKFYRIKNNTIYEKTVVLNQFSKNNFLCIDFNKSIFGDHGSDKGKAFIGSSSGTVYQISCISQELESIYLVHNSPILSISSNEIFVVTGSADGYCRVWPAGFEEFIMEARHDSSICSIDISYDSMDILCGTLNGSIGSLNVHNKNYTTLIRSPNCNIKKLVLHPLNNYIFTIENNDMYDTLRIWDLQNKDEIFEFKSENDSINCVNANILNSFVCGFSSGIIKVLDYEKNELIYQCKPFRSAVADLIFVQSSSKLIAMSAFGNISIHDCFYNYKQIKIINIKKPCLYTDISLSPDQNYYATIGSESKTVLTWNSESFAIKNNINLFTNLAKTLCIFNKNLLGVGLDNCSIRFYALGKYDGILIREIKDVHIKGINKIICSKNYNYFMTSGDEGLIKIWDTKMIFNIYKSFQQYIGHSNGVNGLISIDNKGIIISSSNNSGIYFWNFLGDIINVNYELLKELDQLDDPIYIKYLTEELNNKCKTSRNSKSLNKYHKALFEDKKDQLLTKDVRVTHMERKYYAENPEINYNTNIYSYNNLIFNDNELNQEEFKLLPKFPMEEEKEKVIINYSNKDFIITKKTLDKYVNWNDKEGEKGVKSKILFSPKFLPGMQNVGGLNKPQVEKKVNQNEQNLYEYKLDFKYCIGLSINSMNNIVFNKKQNWYA